MTKNIFFLLFKKTKKTLKPEEREFAQKLAEAGAKLRQFREEHSICLDRVAAVTMIRGQLLQAIEEGQLDQLPEPVYTQGLIKRYAEAMGLDGEQFSNFFPAETAQPTVQSSWRDWPAAQLRPLHLYLLYVLLIIGSVNGLSQVMSRSGDTVPEPSLTATRKPTQPSTVSSGNAMASPPQSTARPSPVVVSSPVSEVKQGDDYAVQKSVNVATVTPQATPSPMPVNTTNSATNTGPVTINVTFKDTSWVQIEVDGKLEFEGELPGGTQRTWQAKEQLVFIAGNAGGVLVAVNNGQAQQLGEPGVVKEVTIKASNSDPANDQNGEG